MRRKFAWSNIIIFYSLDWKCVFSAKPNSLPLTIKLIDECASEDLASIFTRWEPLLVKVNIDILVTRTTQQGTSLHYWWYSNSPKEVLHKDVTDSALNFQIWKAVAIGGSSFSSIDGGELHNSPHFETKSTMSGFCLFGAFSSFLDALASLDFTLVSK